MQTEWRTDEDLPQWADAAKDVEAVLDDGSTVTGWLAVEEIIGIDGEDFPEFDIVPDAGPFVPFVRARKWRIVNRS
jgi:hypothetical protein